MFLQKRSASLYKKLLFLTAFLSVVFFISCKQVVVAETLVATIPADSRIIYMTDLEGDKTLLDELVANKELQWSNGQLEFTGPKTVLVFGGDLTDRGPYNIRLMRWLNNLKQRYRNRVVILWGNRDLNKLKFLAAEKELREGHNKVFTEWLSKNNFPNTLENQLIWFFEHDLGLRDFFALRFEELVEIGDVKKSLPLDQQRTAAAKLIFDQLKPGGEYFKYIESGQILFRHKNMAFLHGGFSGSNIGAIPRKQRVEANEWLGEGPNSLNRWGRESISEIKKNYAANKPYGDFLFSYGDSVWNPLTNTNQGRYESVIYPIRIEEEGVFRLPNKKVMDYLKTAGVDTEILGHTPAGSSPMPLLGENYLRVMGDTSFGSKKGYLKIEKNGVVTGQGLTKSGQKIGFRLRSDWSSLSGPERRDYGLSRYAGRLIDGSVIVGQLEKNGTPVSLKFEGFNVIETQIATSKLNPTVEKTYPIYQVNEAFEAMRFTKNNVTQIPVYDRFVFKDFVGTRRLIWFSGSSEGSWGFVSEPNRKVAKDFIDNMIASLDPSEVVIATAGTEFGIHKLLHDAIERHNQKNPNERFTTIGLIAEIANSSQIAAGLDGVVVTGKYWEATGPVAIDVVTESNGHAVFIGGGGIVKGELGFIKASHANFSVLKGPEGAANDLAQTSPQNAVSSAAEVIAKLAKTRAPAKTIKVTEGSGSLEDLSNARAAVSFIEIGKTTNDLSRALQKYGQQNSNAVVELMNSYKLDAKQVEEVIRRISVNPEFIEAHQKESVKTVDIVKKVISEQVRDVKAKY